MNKKKLSEDLLNNNFNLNRYHNYEKIFEGLDLTVIIYSSLFGKIKMIGVMYKFKNKLEEELHDEVWNKSISIIGTQNSCLQMGSLGFEYMESSILDRTILNDINAEKINEYCNKFANSIKPLLNEYNL